MDELDEVVWGIIKFIGGWALIILIIIGVVLFIVAFWQIIITVIVVFITLAILSEIFN